MSDMKQLLESITRLSSANPKQKPGDQWLAKDKRPPGQKLVGEDAELQSLAASLLNEYKHFVEAPTNTPATGTSPVANINPAATGNPAVQQNTQQNNQTPQQATQQQIQQAQKANQGQVSPGTQNTQQNINQNPQAQALAKQALQTKQKNLNTVKAATNLPVPNPNLTGQALDTADQGKQMSATQAQAVAKGFAPALGDILDDPNLSGQFKNLIQKAGSAEKQNIIKQQGQ